jgi:1-phosphatidylinositol-4-phosphate 5-kinase
MSENPNSFLARIYGIYSVQMKGHCAVHLMLMEHTLQIKDQDNLQRVFDLKGSTTNRRVHLDHNTSRSKTLKD